MRVHVLYFAGVRQAVSTREESLSLPEGASLDQLWTALAGRHPEISGWKGRLKLAVNEEFAEGRTPLKEGDVVALLPPVSGGSPRARLEEAPLNPAGLAGEISGRGEGACVTFTGIVRPIEKGAPIRALSYEAYPPMAARKLEAVCDEARARFPILEIRISHRQGDVPAGQIAVAIVVTSERREAALAACRFAIERVKEIVPIWKIS